MPDLSRRAVLVAACGVSVGGTAFANQQAASPAPAKTSKAEFVRQVNAHWLAENEKAEARAKAEEKRGSFSSLAPPEMLVPFKDWDYYYTKGVRAKWKPNPGQTYKEVIVPAGFVTDLTSIPQEAWSLGLRPEGPYAYAALVHDYLYWTQERTRKEADEIFLFAMEDSNVDKTLRKGMYAFVDRLGGRAWDSNAKLKKQGERRLLRGYPPTFTPWSEWKKSAEHFRDS
jgi:hypothetical protein